MYENEKTEEKTKEEGEKEGKQKNHWVLGQSNKFD